MSAVGLGCNSQASVAAIVACVREAGARAACEIEALHTGADVRSAALEAAAVELGLPLIRHDAAALTAVAHRVLSQSPRVGAKFGVGSIAEAAALAGAGQGARLVVPKFSADGVSCAVAST